MEKSVDKLAEEALNLLIENKCLDCKIYDLRGFNRFVDFAVIGTYTSRSHLSGVSRYLEEWLDEKGLRPLNRRPLNGEKWFYWDCGTFTVNLMDKESRDFYRLEDLWYNAGDTQNSSSSPTESYISSSKSSSSSS